MPIQTNLYIPRTFSSYSFLSSPMSTRSIQNHHPETPCVDITRCDVIPRLIVANGALAKHFLKCLGSWFLFPCLPRLSAITSLSVIFYSLSVLSIFFLTRRFIGSITTLFHPTRHSFPQLRLLEHVLLPPVPSITMRMLLHSPRSHPLHP